MIEITPVFPGFVATVAGPDLRQRLSDQDIATIRTAIDEYAVLVFRGQDISDAQQIDFSLRFGTLEKMPEESADDQGERHFSPFIEDVSNLDEANRPFEQGDPRHVFSLGNRLWHSDSSLRVVPPKYSILSGRVVVRAGGHTQFADMRAGYAALSAEDQSLVDGLSCEHSWANSLALLGITDLSQAQRDYYKPALQPLVRRHPANGRPALFLSSHIGDVVGWTRHASRAFLYDLTEHALRASPIYSHEWSPHDMLMWDNRSTMHRVTRYDLSQPRDLRRTTVSGDPVAR